MTSSLFWGFVDSSCSDRTVLFCLSLSLLGSFTCRSRLAWLSHPSESADPTDTRPDPKWMSRFRVWTRPETTLKMLCSTSVDLLAHLFLGFRATISFKIPCLAPIFGPFALYSRPSSYSHSWATIPSCGYQIILSWFYSCVLCAYLRPMLTWFGLGFTFKFWVSIKIQFHTSLSCQLIKKVTSVSNRVYY